MLVVWRLGAPQSKVFSVNTFDQQVVDAVISHMSDDHGEDNLIIAKANGAPEATASEMVDLDFEGGVWRVTENGETRDLKIAWPSGPILERPQIRREVVILYRASCKALGVEPRQEETSTHHPASGHGASPHGGSPHGAHPHGAPGAEQSDGEKPFSVIVREGSWADHDDSEGSTFMENIMRGIATLDDYVALVVQHYYMYVALEEVTAEFADNEMFAPFHDDALYRMNAIEADLTKFYGENWNEQISAVPATVQYMDRIREVAKDNWVPGVIAHHYTRYLGDLSGGQMIAKRVSRQHGFTDGEGIAFYNFDALNGIQEFKERYRVALDALGDALSEEERARMVEEVRLAYAFNTRVFIDLDKQKAAQAV